MGLIASQYWNPVIIVTLMSWLYTDCFIHQSLPFISILTLYFSERLTLTPTTPVCTCRKVNVRGTGISISDYVLVKWLGSDKLPLFGRVKTFVEVDAIIYILLEAFVSKSYSEHFHAFQIETSEICDLKLIEEIELPKPLLSQVQN